MSIHPAITSAPSFAGPLYAQVASILRAKICASEWTSRAPLPNEATLARDIGVSVGTVRKALEMLEDESLIQRRQGRGTFVVETSHETELERFSNHVSAGRKLRADPVVWTSSLDAPTPEEAHILAIEAGGQVARLQCVWSAAGKFTAIENVAVRAARFPGLKDHLSEAGQFLFPIYRRHYQVVVNRVTEALAPVNASDAVAATLKVRKDHALLRVTRTAYAMSIGPVEISVRTMHLADASYFVSMT